MYKQFKFQGRIGKCNGRQIMWGGAFFQIEAASPAMLAAIEKHTGYTL